MAVVIWLILLLFALLVFIVIEGVDVLINRVYIAQVIFLIVAINRLIIFLRVIVIVPINFPD